MRSAARRPLALLVALLCAGAAWGQRAPRVAGDLRVIRGGEYQPFYRLAGRNRVAVRAFAIEVTPVTNARYLAFVQANPAWQRSRARRLLADAEYLAHWASDKADVDYWAARVKPGTMLYEMAGVPENVAKQALARVAQKMPVKTRFVGRRVRV